MLKNKDVEFFQYLKVMADYLMQIFKHYISPIKGHYLRFNFLAEFFKHIICKLCCRLVKIYKTTENCYFTKNIWLFVPSDDWSCILQANIWWSFWFRHTEQDHISTSPVLWVSNALHAQHYARYIHLLLILSSCFSDADAYSTLKHLSNVKRFSMNVRFLSSVDNKSKHDIIHENDSPLTNWWCEVFNYAFIVELEEIFEKLSKIRPDGDIKLLRSLYK